MSERPYKVLILDSDEDTLISLQQVLEIRFGPAYLEYRSRMPRFWPRKPLSPDRHRAQVNRAGN